MKIPVDAKPGDMIAYTLKNGHQGMMLLPTGAKPGKTTKVKAPVENLAGEVTLSAEILESFRRPKQRDDHPCAILKTKSHKKTMTLMGRRVKVKNMSNFGVPEDSLGTVAGDEKVYMFSSFFFSQFPPLLPLFFFFSCHFFDYFPPLILSKFPPQIIYIS